jgi:hypothetical protein
MAEAIEVSSKRVRKSMLRPSIISFAGLGIFLALAFLAEWFLKPVFTQAGLVWAGVGMSLIPALIWLFFFYMQDQREPEPKEMVIEVFILGALLAAAVGIPLVNNVFNVSAWIYNSLAIRFLFLVSPGSAAIRLPIQRGVFLALTAWIPLGTGPGSRRMRRSRVGIRADWRPIPMQRSSGYPLAWELHRRPK